MIMCFNPHNNFLYFVKSEGFLLNKRNSTFSLTLTVLSLNNKSGGNMENLQNIKFGYILSEQGGGVSLFNILHLFPLLKYLTSFYSSESGMLNPSQHPLPLPNSSNILKLSFNFNKKGK